MSTTFLHAWGKHDIQGIYGVWSLLYYHSSLRFKQQLFWDGFWDLWFIILSFVFSHWMEENRD